jgi:hypothetical protein
MPSMNPTERVTHQIPNCKPMKTSEYGRQKKRSEVDSLMAVIPQACPRIGQAGEESNLPFYLKRQGNGRSVDDKEEKIGEHPLTLGIRVAIEKHQKRGKRMNHEQGRAENQTVFHRAIHINEAGTIP